MSSLNFTIHTCTGKSVISNRERGVEVAKINDHDKKGNKYTTMIYFAMQNSAEDNAAHSDLRLHEESVAIDG